MVGLDRMLDLANNLGIHSFKSVDSYGLALTLGGGEVRLLELTAAYAAFDNGGVRVDPFAISRVTDQNEQVLYAHDTPDSQEPVVDPRVAWLITSILSDNAARASEFGENSVLRLSHMAAVKTGTTTDWRDNWTVGYTPDLVTGVWTGNANGEPMIRVSGMSGAGPIWHDFMEQALRGQPLLNFSVPDGIVPVTVCALSGMLPSADCPHTRTEWFVKGSEPDQVDNWFIHQKIDMTTGKLANANTPPGQEVDRVMIQLPAEARAWANEQGWPVALLQEGTDAGCAEQSCMAVVINQPDPGSIYRISEQLPRSVQKVPIEVNVQAAQIDHVDVILDDKVVIAQFYGSAYNGFWLLEPGDHRFVARATMHDGTHQESAPVDIHVVE
jgi:membrane carboxypeptidase/penicillin-binding protein PbpC